MHPADPDSKLRSISDLSATGPDLVRHLSLSGPKRLRRLVRPASADGRQSGAAARFGGCWKAWLEGHTFDLESLAETFRNGEPMVAKDASEGFYVQSRPGLCTASEGATVRQAGGARAGRRARFPDPGTTRAFGLVQGVGNPGAGDRR